ncbi:nucleolus and neural progenitor protein isoform X2 [Hyla sarda]|uniref:nucleolus and neural progenitor protein isoform X2 n=1 Tax=Hyla sarda TaxID=327740 RepID=UPI0024C4402C|nr:nucleolus and neural progenitor protein isoform X2 [Hyla sarda]
MEGEKCIQDVVEKCSAVHSFLKSQALNAEVATLDSILYVFHHRLSGHKSYLALKQVQQCTRRVKSMDLEGSLKEIMELCPKKADLESVEYCTVPSQPILELVSMKILGSCKLLVRLMDCCCKAFHLCIQHLSFNEYIVMNVVLLALLSRLWIMYRGLLKRLMAFYSVHICLQKEVSDFQKMPYFKDFVFPTAIEEHIGSGFNDLFRNKLQNLFTKKSKTQILNKIFDTSNGIKDKLSKIKDIGTIEAHVDVGLPIQMQRFKRDTLDTYNVKALCLQVKEGRLQGLGSEKNSNQSKKHCRKKCVRHLVPKLQEAEDFKALFKQLLYAVKWCKERKLQTEAVFFRNRYLRCNRLQHAEALGYSLKKKLQWWKKSMCHSLREQTLRKDHPMQFLRLQRFQRTWKHMVTLSQKHRRVKTRDLQRSPLCSDLFSAEQVPSSAASVFAPRPVISRLQESSSIGANQCLTDTDDIDDIFSSIGI